MNEEDLNINDSFQVKESALIGFLFSFIFFAMFIGALVTINFNLNYPIDVLRFILYGTLFPAIIFLIKAINKKVIIEINNTGIWYKGTLITSWDNYVNAYIFQEEIPGSLDENIRLSIEYYVPDKDINYISVLKMENSQNKSEEQIICAINNFLTTKQT